MNQITKPNSFQLRGAGGVEINYSTSSFSGEPLLNVRHGQQTFSFRGDQISALPTEIGVMVTVMLSASPDLKSEKLTLVVPDINLQKRLPAAVSTVVIFTTTKDSIGGPALVRGQIQSYRTLTVRGTAEDVDF